MQPTDREMPGGGLDDFFDQMLSGLPTAWADLGSGKYPWELPAAVDGDPAFDESALLVSSHRHHQISGGGAAGNGVGDFLDQMMSMLPTPWWGDPAFDESALLTSRLRHHQISGGGAAAGGFLPPSVPEETATGFPATYPSSSSYLESIRSVDAPQWRIRSTLFPQSGHSGSSYSTSYSGGSCSTNLSNISGCSSGLVSSAAWDFDVGEITQIAQKMVSDGYIQQMVQAFSGQNPDSVLEAWFVELDVAWVLPRHVRDSSWFQLQTEEILVDRWIRSLTLITVSIKELVAAGHGTLAVARFGKASISAMLHFFYIFFILKLHHKLLLYLCVSNASYDMSTLPVFSSSEDQSNFNEVCDLLKRREDKLNEDICEMIAAAKVKALHNVFDIEILRGRGEIHQSVRYLMDYIVPVRKAQASSQGSAQSHNSKMLCDLIDGTMGYVKNMLHEKSELCLDPSLRYIFLLNNSNFVAQVSEPSISLDIGSLSVHHKGLELTPECEKHMDSYLEVSWEHVVSCISASKISGPLRHRRITSSLTKFQSAFHKTCQDQKFWKVPDPRLRSLLREAITKKVISPYRDYLKEHPELEKQGSDGSSNPDVLEQMVGELFEG